MEFPQYPEERMRHILGVLTEQIIGCVQDKLSVTNVMTEPFIKVRMLVRYLYSGRTQLHTGVLMQIKHDLRAAIALLETWESAITTLTGRLWPHNAAHQWTGPIFKHDQLTSVMARLQEVP